jgi:hypothetical protein
MAMTVPIPRAAAKAPTRPTGMALLASRCLIAFEVVNFSVLAAVSFIGFSLKHLYLSARQMKAYGDSTRFSEIVNMRFCCDAFTPSQRPFSTLSSATTAPFGRVAAWSEAQEFAE